MKIYIAGKITDNPDYMEHFAEAETQLKREGYAVMNPTILPPGFEHHEYMRVCFGMIDACSEAYFLSNWRDSKGAMMEHDYASKTGKVIHYEGEACK